MAVAPEPHAAAQALDGRRAAQAVTVEDLFALHRRRIYGYCLRRLWSPEEAEDAVQTTYMRAWRSLHDGRVPYSPLAWLYEIARNVCARSLERRSRHGALVPLDDETASEEGSSRARDELFGLDEALVRIPERQRRALLLREWRGLSYKEIAEEMGLSASAVEMLIFRSRRALAAELERPSAPRRFRMPSIVAWLDSLRSAIPHSVSTSMATGLAVATAMSASPTLFQRDLTPRSLPAGGEEAALLLPSDDVVRFDGRSLTPLPAKRMETGGAGVDPDRGQPGNEGGQEAAPTSGSGSTVPENQSSGPAAGAPTAQPNEAPLDPPGQPASPAHPPTSAPAQPPDSHVSGGHGATPATPAIPATPGQDGTPAIPATPATPATPPSHSNGHEQKHS